MLILDRKIGERIVIDGPCVIHVVKSKRGRLRIGVEAESHVLAMRAELLLPEPEVDVDPEAKTDVIEEGECDE
jgi:carbon storage regulator CsrA